MSINPKIVSSRLKQARELQSFALEDVSSGTGIVAERLRQIEDGMMVPSGDELLMLASFYRHDFREFLDEGALEPFKSADILYRRNGDSFSADDRRAIQEFLFLCQCESVLEAQLNKSKKEFSFFPQGSKYKLHGESAARELRVHLDYAANAISRDVFDDFRQIGFHIFRRRLSNPDISGLYIEHAYAGHCILINYDEDIYRQRFSASHEAAHAIFDSSESALVTFRSGSSKYDRSDLKEFRANRFASCYLMPPDQLPAIQQWSAELAVEWAQRLRVSTAALAIALLEAGKVSKDAAQLIRSVKVPFSEKIDPEAPQTLSSRQKDRRLELLRRGFSDYYVGLCFSAYQSGHISAGHLAEILLADHVEVREIAVLYGRSIQHEF